MLLSQPEVRLVTLMGMGGIGKTRLAVQVGTELAEAFAHGAWFVSLASIRQPKLVIPTIGQTLGLHELSGRTSFEQLVALLRARQLLLVLDNFEQVLAAAPRLVELLSACPQLKLLVTSRAALHVQGEYEYTVLPLALPDLQQLLTLQTLSEYTAVSPFVQRAQAIEHSFRLNEHNGRAIAELCLRLEGVPLALELAAVRTRLLSPQSLLARMQSPLSLLTEGNQDAPARHRTLRNSFSWSYDLLGQEEQRLFRRLAVFVEGSTLEAIEAICNTRGDLSTPVLDLVSSLLDKGLLSKVEQADGEPRVRQMEIMRDFGRACLEEAGEVDQARGAHAGYYLALVEETKAALEGALQANWQGRLNQELGNIRVAFDFLLEQQETEVASRLAASLLLLGTILHNQGELAEAETMFEEALKLSRQLGDTHLLATVLGHIGPLAQIRGEFSRSPRQVLGATSKGEAVLLAPPPALASTPPTGLTHREFEVLKLVIQGLTNLQIADQLVISHVTVNAHLRSIYSKLGVNSRVGAMRYAIDHDLLGMEQL